MEIVEQFIETRKVFLTFIGAKPDSIVIDCTDKEFVLIGPSNNRKVEMFDDNENGIKTSTIIPTKNFQNWQNILITTVGRSVYLLDYSKQLVQK